MYIYNFQGFVKGIPARNLSEDEARAIGINKVLASGLYIHVSDGTSDAPKRTPARKSKFEKRPSDDGGLE